MYADEELHLVAFSNQNFAQVVVLSVLRTKSVDRMGLAGSRDQRDGCQ